MKCALFVIKHPPAVDGKGLLWQIGRDINHWRQHVNWFVALIEFLYSVVAPAAGRNCVLLMSTDVSVRVAEKL
jgi:hypothetical protein